jgi:hypothetical protein
MLLQFAHGQYSKPWYSTLRYSAVNTGFVVMTECSEYTLVNSMEAVDGQHGKAAVIVQNGRGLPAHADQKISNMER